MTKIYKINLIWISHHFSQDYLTNDKSKFDLKYSKYRLIICELRKRRLL